MKKRIFALLLCLMLAVLALPAMFEARAVATTVTVNGTELSAGGTTSISFNDGTNSGTASFSNGVLTLDNVALSVKVTTYNDAIIKCDGDLTISLVGTSTLTNTGQQSHVISVNGDLTFTGSGSLACNVTDTGGNSTNNRAYDPLYVSGTLNFGGTDPSDAFSGSVKAYAPTNTQAG